MLFSVNGKMNPHLRSALPLLEFIYSLEKKDRETFLKRSKNIVVKTIVDTVFNTYKGNFDLPPQIVEKLRPLQNKIKKLCAKKKPLKTRRKELIADDLFKNLFQILLPFFLEQSPVSEQLPAAEPAEEVAT